jgi:putative ABC transport system ATP-binding protein
MSTSKTGGPLIELCRVAKTYREGETDRHVLTEVDVTIARGEIVALLGPSGSGKSTILNLIGGIDWPTRGDVSVGGRSLPALSEHERALYRRRTVGFVFQSFNLIPTLSVRENVRLPLELTGVDGVLARERIDRLLTEVGLSDRAETFPERLSGGEQQRVALVRAVVHRPLVVLADEPTGNLDVESARQVLGLLRRLACESDATVVIATHSAEAAGIADRVLMIVDGRVVEGPRAPAS